MRLERILHKINNEIWAIRPSQHAAIRQLLSSHLAGSPLPDYASLEQDTPPYSIVGNTAVLDVAGVILNKASGLETLCGAFSLETFKQNLSTVAASSDVENIVLNISSGGGIITGVPEAADLIAAVGKEKDTYAYSNDVIASAAYWLASQCEAIFISKSAEVGSIGVYSYLIDSSQAFAIQGLKPELFKAGDFKAAGIDGIPLTNDQRALFQASVDKAYQQFVSYVTAARKGIPQEALQGQMFDSGDATANNLIDGVVNSLDDLLATLNG